jgi:hypothetical protein
MDYVVMLNGVVPGPACVIPEEKKIFRVTAEALGSGSVDQPECDKVPDCAGRDLPLPVPHMYSA